VEVPTGLPPFRADGTLLLHAVANLLLNAIRHTPDGTAITITAGADAAAGRVHLTVADHGPGLPADMRQRLFEKFQRGKSARTGGLGLGLSIVYGFVTAQGGTVEAGENPGGGATFTIFLPQAPMADFPRDE
jgi:two-component system sensor histidine kinase KdpD